jgi:hypothetical protein
VAFTPHLTTLLLFSISLYLTARALRVQKQFWLWMPVSILLGITQIFMMEYFVVLEVLRPVIIWFILRDQRETGKRAALRTILYWLPFLAGMSAYLWWRLVFLPTTMIGIDPNSPVLLKAFLLSPLDALFSLAQKIFGDLRYLLVDVWANALFIFSRYDLHSKILWTGLALGLLAGLLFGYYISRTSSRQADEVQKNDFQLFLFGLIAFLAGGIPIWMMGRQASVGNWSDRFSISMMLGSVVLVIFLVVWLIKTGKQKNLIFSLLLGFSISSQIWNSNTYRLDWELQRNIYWQMAWRIPSLEPGTTIIGRGTFTAKSSYLDATYIMNLLFDQTPAANPAYGYLDVFHILPDEKAGYQRGIPVSISTRSGKFSGSTSQAIGMYFNLSGGCIRILDEAYRDDMVFANDINSGNRMNQLIAISDVSLIGSAGDPVNPSPAIFGAEPMHGWCYYFEKADLARQQEDWQRVLQLETQANSDDLHPVMGGEYIPFIEANAHLGNWSKAYSLSQAALQTSPDLEASLCNTWNRLAGIPGSEAGTLTIAKGQGEYCASDTR